MNRCVPFERIDNGRGTDLICSVLVGNPYTASREPESTQYDATGYGEEGLSSVRLRHSGDEQDTTDHNGPKTPSEQARANTSRLDREQGGRRVVVEPFQERARDERAPVSGWPANERSRRLLLFGVGDADVSWHEWSGAGSILLGVSLPLELIPTGGWVTDDLGTFVVMIVAGLTSAAIGIELLLFDGEHVFDTPPGGASPSGS